MSLKEQFDAAVKVIQSLPKNGIFQPSDEMRLRFYAFYKQATEGPNQTKKPAFYEIVNKYKWEAWKQCGNMSKEEAMKLYVDELKKVIETLSLNHETSEFLDQLGPFYEFLPDLKDGEQQHQKHDEIQLLQEPVSSSNDHHFKSFDSEGDEFIDTVDHLWPQNYPPKIFGSKTEQNLRFEFDQQHNVNPKSFVYQLVNPHVLPYPDTSTNHGYIPEDSYEAASSPNEELMISIFKLRDHLENLERKVLKLEEIERRRMEREQELDRIKIHNQGYNLWTLLIGGGGGKDSVLRSYASSILFISWPFIVFFLLNYLKRIKKR